MNQKVTGMIENFPHSLNFYLCGSASYNLSLSNKNENLKMFDNTVKNIFLNLIIRNHFDS